MENRPFRDNATSDRDSDRGRERGDRGRERGDRERERGDRGRERGDREHGDRDQADGRRRRRGVIGHVFEPGEDVIFDYKDVDRIRNFLAPSGKILARRQTGLDAKQQRRLSRAIKRGRFLALLPFTQRR